jgi:ribosomal protein S18 acetylase RimI-like enzyme
MAMVVAMGSHTGMFEIRQAKASDARGIAEVRVRTWQEAYRDIMPTEFLAALSVDADEKRWRGLLKAQAPERRTLVAESGGQVVGFVTAGVLRGDETEPLTGEVYAIYARPDRWGQGVGRKLLGQAEKDLVELGYEEAVLWVLTDNQRARAFYERAGWHADGGTKRATFGGREVEEVRYRIALRRSRVDEPA